MDNTVNQPQEKTINLEHRVSQLRQLRAKIDAMEEEHKNKIEPYIVARKALEGALMQWLIDHKIKTTNTAAGNITWVDNTTYPIEDQVAFSGFVIENRAWEMIDWKANKTATVKFIEENNELPPGLRENPHPHLRVSGPGKKTNKPNKAKFDIEETPEED